VEENFAQGLKPLIYGHFCGTTEEVAEEHN
jgi:hypothetical protein